MHLAAPIIVMQDMSLDEWRLSSNDVFFLPSLFFFPPLKNAMGIAKKSKKSGYLFIESNWILIFFIAIYLILNY
jgi:hypothetical protein